MRLRRDWRFDLDIIFLIIDASRASADNATSILFYKQLALEMS
jgi:hypothetical protein